AERRQVGCELHLIAGPEQVIADDRCRGCETLCTERKRLGAAIGRISAVADARRAKRFGRGGPDFVIALPQRLARLSDGTGPTEQGEWQASASCARSGSAIGRAELVPKQRRDDLVEFRLMSRF